MKRYQRLGSKKIVCFPVSVYAIEYSFLALLCRIHFRLVPEKKPLTKKTGNANHCMQLMSMTNSSFLSFIDLPWANFKRKKMQIQSKILFMLR